MKMTTMAAVAVVMIGCIKAGPAGEQGPPGEQGPAGPSGPAGPEGTAVDGVEWSGERITRIMVETKDGARAGLGWWDGEWDAECDWVRVRPPEMGEVAMCLPLHSYASDFDAGQYQDEKCTVHISLWPTDFPEIDKREVGVWTIDGNTYTGPYYTWESGSGCNGPLPAFDKPFATYKNVTEAYASGPVSH